MAKSRDGLFGSLSGRIGDIVFSSWKGVPNIRSRPAGNPSNTPAQQKQRGKFGLVIAFISKIRPVINAGFKLDTDRMTELNSATSFLMKRAVTSEPPGLRLDYPSVMVARGDLPKPRRARAERQGGTLTFTWSTGDNAPGSSPERQDDRVLALAWCPEADAGAWIAGDDGTRRGDGEIKLELPEEWQDLAVECYLAFASKDGREASDSVYVGRVGGR